jgi:hypothetical protein
MDRNEKLFEIFPIANAIQSSSIHAVHIAWRAESKGQHEGDVNLLPTM